MRTIVDTIQDYIDRRDRLTKWRTSPDIVPLRTLNQAWTSLGAVVYDYDENSAGLGWHQQTSSISHPTWNFYQRMNFPPDRRPRNTGGPFITTKLEVRLPSRQGYDLVRYSGGGQPLYAISGDLFPHLGPQRICKAIRQGTIRNESIWTEDSSLNTDDLRVIGEKLMLSLVPTSAAFNAVTALGEPISDGAFFGLPGRALLNANPGGEFLNFQFGILPTISDIQNFNTALESYSKVIAQYHRDAGKIIRRKTRPYDIPEVVTTSTFSTVPVTVDGRAVSANLATTTSGTYTKSIKRQVWYSGAFEYHIPEHMSKFQELMYDWQRAFHIAPSPADVWELLPFSWLADYFTNGGNSMRHLFLQSSEGAVQRYGYVMCTTEVVETYVWTGTLRVGGVPVPSSITAVVEKTIKQRARVSPFGVHFTGVDLSPRQLAILAALGIAK